VRLAVSRHCDRSETAMALARLVKEHGIEVPGLAHGLSHAFPSADTLADADLGCLGSAEAAQAVRGLSQGVASGAIRLDGSVGLEDFVASVTAVAGFGPTAAQHLAMRMSERDAFPEADPRILRVLKNLDPAADPAASAEAWRPWRALAATHLLAHHASKSTRTPCISGP